MEIKEKLKQEEELLIKVFKLEKFVKKYKFHLIGAGVLIVLIAIGSYVNSYLKEQKLIKTNEAYNKLLANPNDKEALKIVKENKKLYDLYLLSTDKIENLQKITTPELKAIAAYKIAMIKGDEKSLENYLLNPEYKILKDPVRFALIRLYLKDGNRKKAEVIYNQLSPNSELKPLAKYLIHYGIVK